MPGRGHPLSARAKPAAVYCRISQPVKTRRNGRVTADGEVQDQESSLDTQERGCRHHAEQRGLVIEDQHIYREVHTGVELWERPELTALRQAIRRRLVQVVVVYAIDRLSRDPVHLGVILSEAEHAGVEICFVTEPLDASPEGQLIRFVRGYAAKVEHEKIKERTMRGKLARLRAGKILPGWKPKYGYLWNADRTGYVLDPETAPIAIRIKDQYLRGHATRRICAELMADAIPTPARSPSGIWRACTIRQILMDPAYAGHPAGMRKQYGKARGKITMRYRPPEEQVSLPAKVLPAFWTWTEHQAILVRLEANKRLSTRNNRSPWESLLRGGYVRCAVCGTTMSVKPKTKTSPLLYQCTSNWGLASRCRRQSLGLPKVDAAVWARVKTILSKPEIVAAELERLRGQDPTQADLAAVAKALAGVERQLQTLVEQLSNLPVGGAVADLVLQKLRQLEEQRTHLGAEHAALQQRRDRWRTSAVQVGNLTEWCRRFAAQLDNVTYERKREAVFMLGVQVNSWPKDHADKPDDVERYEIRASVPLDAQNSQPEQVLDTCSTPSTV
jgi:site-specific DNA recombinase